MSIGTDIRRIAQVDQRLDGYLLGLRHGISLADLDDRYNAQLKEIEELRYLWREKDGKTGRTKDHQGD